MSVVLSAILACTINTGLDPACPLTGAGLTGAQQTITPAATLAGTTIFAQRAWNGRNQFRVDFPVREHLSINGVGSASGRGDLSAAFTTRLQPELARFDETLGAALTLPTGSDAFSAGRAYLDPSYSLTYHAARGISLIGLVDYAFPVGGTRLPYAPNLQTLNVRGRALAVAHNGIYGALEAGFAGVHGDERYTAYDGRVIVGAVFAHRYNASVWYDQPFSQFTKDHVFEHGLGFSLSLQR